MYDFGMRCAIEAGSRIAAWLLCAVLAWLAVSPPHCDLCDGPYETVVVSLFHLCLDHPVPIERDTCNGVCPCCEFHWLPDVRVGVSSIQTVSTASLTEESSPDLAPRAALFRPPRIGVSQ
jgi:hypothetical protein